MDERTFPIHPSHRGWEAQSAPTLQPSAVHHVAVFTPLLHSHLRQDEVIINNTRPASPDATVNRWCRSRWVICTGFSGAVPAPSTGLGLLRTHGSPRDQTPLLSGSSVSSGWREMAMNELCQPQGKKKTCGITRSGFPHPHLHLFPIPILFSSPSPSSPPSPTSSPPHPHPHSLPILIPIPSPSSSSSPSPPRPVEHPRGWRPPAPGPRRPPSPSVGAAPQPLTAASAEALPQELPAGEVLEPEAAGDPLAHRPLPRTGGAKHHRPQQLRSHNLLSEPGTDPCGGRTARQTVPVHPSAPPPRPYPTAPPASSRRRGPYTSAGRGGGGTGGMHRPPAPSGRGTLGLVVPGPGVPVDVSPHRHGGGA